MNNTAPNVANVTWNEWNPGLDNDALTLGEAKATLPGANPEDISLMVRLLENPKSPLALTGAVTLERHDCIHILLGRGLLNQDEAFVIGFTMGTAKEELGALQKFVFKSVARYLYPTNYRLSKENLKAYELGVRTGQEFGTHKIYRFPFEECYSRTLGSLRQELNIDTNRLKEIFREEQQMLPGTKPSLRLPVA